MSETTAWDEPRTRFKEVVKRRIVSHFSAGLVGGTPHADYLASLGMPRDRIFLGYDAVDNQYFDEKCAEVRGRGAEDRDQRTEVRGQDGLPGRCFLASARFVEKKNLPRLIQAYARYREMAEVRRQKSDVSSVCSISPTSDLRPLTSDLCPPPDLWSLVLLGDGPLKSDLCRLIADLGLVDFVHLPGFKQYHELPEYYARASAFIHASTTEQWGLVVNEAMASGLPVLVSNRCGCARDLVQEGVNGFTFDPYDIEEMAKLMFRLTEIPKYRNTEIPVTLTEMGDASRRLISNWGTDRFAEGMRHAVEVALAKPPPGSSLSDRLLMRAMLWR